MKYQIRDNFGQCKELELCVGYSQSEIHEVLSVRYRVLKIDHNKRFVRVYKLDMQDSDDYIKAYTKELKTYKEPDFFHNYKRDTLYKSLLG